MAPYDDSLTIDIKKFNSKYKILKCSLNLILNCILNISQIRILT